MKLIIVFTGLIAHIASGPNWWAVAVEAEHHKPQLVVRADALVTPCKAPVCVPSANKTVTIDLTEDQFTIDGLASAAHPAKAPEFDSSVPSLQAILQAAVDPEVETGNVAHSGVAASIQLGGGTISPGSCMLDAAEWPGAGAPLPECLAENIVWIGNLKENAETFTLKGTKNSWTFKAGARLAFRNEHPGNHFPLLNKLSKGSSVKRTPRPSNKAICVLCTRVDIGEVERGFTSPDLECTPTRYP